MCENEYLIIDDDIIMHLIYTKKLKADPRFSHFRAKSCYTFDEAILALTNYPADGFPAFIMLDVELGLGKTGWDILKSETAKRIPTDTKIFVCTSSGSETDREISKGFKQVSAYFVKPIYGSTIDNIYTIINQAVSR